MNEEGWGTKVIDALQWGGDLASVGLGLVPGLNYAGAALQAGNAWIDKAQGQDLDAGVRAGMAAMGLIPGVGSVGQIALRAGGKGLVGGAGLAAKMLAKRAATSGGLAQKGLNIAKGISKGIGKRTMERSIYLDANQRSLVPALGGGKVVPRTGGREWAKKMVSRDNAIAAWKAKNPKLPFSSGGAASGAKIGSKLLKTANIIGLGAYGNELLGNPLGKLYNKIAGDKTSKGTAPSLPDKNVHPSTLRDEPSQTSGSGNAAFGINQSDTASTQSAAERFKNKF